MARDLLKLHGPWPPEAGARSSEQTDSYTRARQACLQSAVTQHMCTRFCILTCMCCDSVLHMLTCTHACMLAALTCRACISSRAPLICSNPQHCTTVAHYHETLGVLHQQLGHTRQGTRVHTLRPSSTAATLWRVLQVEHNVRA
jgi:hypothetical protein